MTVQAGIKTALLVVVLSCLIWVFAERAVMQTDTVTVAVELVRSRPDVFVQYLNDQGEPLTALQQNVVLTVADLDQPDTRTTYQDVEVYGFLEEE